MRRLINPFLLLAATALITSVQAQNTQQPNFIVIMADDLGFGDLGVYGSQLIKTPNLDRMALEGARLDSFYSSANVCTAARGGLLTGRYPIRLDLVSDVARPTNNVHLASEEISLAEALRLPCSASGIWAAVWSGHLLPRVSMNTSAYYIAMT